MEEVICSFVCPIEESTSPSDYDEYTRSRELTALFNEESGEWELHENDSTHFVIPASQQVEFEL